VAKTPRSAIARLRFGLRDIKHHGPTKRRRLPRHELEERFVPDCWAIHISGFFRKRVSRRHWQHVAQRLAGGALAHRYDAARSALIFI
jgi:hypothetical protein